MVSSDVKTYHNIRVCIGECFDTLDARSLGSEGESGKANRFQERGLLVTTEYAVNYTVHSLSNGRAQNWLVDGPELGHEVVDPFSCFVVVLELWVEGGTGGTD
jgi:hypothetical protein